MSELKAIRSGEIYNIIEYEDCYRTDDLYYPKSEVDKVIAEKDAEIAGLKAAAKEPSVPNRTCRKCGSAGTLMYMPIVKDMRTYWDLYNNKGMDYVVGIQCAHCGEVAFVTKQTHEYELRKLKRALWLARAKAYRYIAELITCFNPDYVRNRKMFTPNNQKQKQMNSLEWARLMLKVESKCRAKAEEYR